MNNLHQNFNNIKNDFEELGDWSSRYQLLIEMSKSLPTLDAALKTEAHLIRGCIAKVWLGANINEQHMLFWGDSDAVMPKGLIALIVKIFSHATPLEIAEFDIDVFAQLGLKQNLTPTRAQAAQNMLNRVRELACAQTERFQ